MKPARNYFPVITSYDFNQGVLDQHNSSNIETQYVRHQPQLKIKGPGGQSSTAVKRIVTGHPYNTRQMTRAKGAILLLCLYYLSQNPASAEPGALNISHPDASTTRNTKSEMDRPPTNQEEVPSQHYQWTPPMMTIILILWIVIFEIIYALYKQIRSWMTAPEDLKKGLTNQVDTTKEDAWAMPTVVTRTQTSQCTDVNERTQYMSGLTEGRDVRPTKLNKDTIHTLFKFQPHSKLEGFLVNKTGTRKDYYTLYELLTHLRDIIQEEGMFDSSNPTIILCSTELEEVLNMKALHVLNIKDLVLSHITRITDQNPKVVSNKREIEKRPFIRISKSGPRPSRVIKLASITKTICTRKDAKFTLAPKLLMVIRSVPGTSTTRTIFTYEDVLRILSVYIQMKRTKIFDHRNNKIALVHDDMLGDALGVKAFSRCQVNGLIRKRLTPVDKINHADITVVTNHSSSDINLMMHSPTPTNNTKMEELDIPDNGGASNPDHKARHRPEPPGTLNTSDHLNETNPTDTFPNNIRTCTSSNRQLSTSRDRAAHKAKKSLVAIMCILPLLAVTADNLDNDILHLRQNTNHMIATRQQSLQDFERIYTNLEKIQPKIDDKRTSNIGRLEWIPSQLSTIATLLHQIINAEESARSRMKNDIQRSGIRNMQHIHASFRTIRNSRKTKRDVTLIQDRVRHKPGQQMDRDSRFIKELKGFFETYDETHKPSARAQQFSLDVQNQFDGNLEELRPIQILMGRSDTSDIRAMEKNWMMEIAKLPKRELIKESLTGDKISPKVIRTINQANKATTAPTKTTPPTGTTAVNTPTEVTPEEDTTTHNTSGLDNVMNLLEELQILNDMLNPQKKDIEEDQKCTPQESRKPQKKLRAPPMCAVYAYQSNSLLEAIDDSRVKIRELDCHVKISTKQISNTTIRTETLIRKTTEERLLRELKSITNDENEINEIISRAQIRAGQVNDGMNILTMKIADRHRTMNVLLEKTDELIHNTIKAEIRRTVGKKVRNKRSHLELTHQVPKNKRHKRNQMGAINLANDAGLLPNSMSTGLNTIKTVQDTVKTLTNAGNLVYDALSGSGSGQEDDDFLKKITDEVEARSKVANERETTIKEGDAVDISCFKDNTGIDTQAVVWMRSDGEFLYNFQLEQRSEKLQISAVNCNDKGSYRCGIKNGEVCDASNIAETWNLHKLNVLCNMEKKTATTPSQVIAGEGESAKLQCSAPTDVNVQWTKTSGIDKEDFSEQGPSITLQSITNTDAGIYTCTYTTQGSPVKEHIILQVHKIPTDGTDPLMRSLGFLEAFDCSQEIIKKDSVDLTQVGRCNKDDYMAYETEQPITIELLHHKTTEEVLLNACQLEIELATAYCRPGNYLSLWTGLGWSSPSAGGGNGLDGFATSLKEDFIVTEHVCRNTWKTGQFEINLGRQQISITVPQGEPSHTRTNLYLHGSTYGQNFNCSPVYGWGASGPVYRGQDNQFSEKISQEVVRAVLTLKLKKVFSLIDTSKGKLYVPSAGKELDVESMGQEYSTNSPSVGTIIILKGDLPLNECDQHFHIAGGVANLYAPRDPDDNDVPKLIRFETIIQGDKRVLGLQQLGEKDVCGATCHSTQFKEIVICTRNSPTDFVQQENKEVLNDLGSSSIALFQVNVDRSIQHLMLTLCLLYRKHQLAALRNIERHGPSLLSPINNGRGIKVVARGEQAIALECPRTTAIPRSEQHACCSNFPVTLIRPDGSTADKYLQSISRQITDLCDPVPCSEVLPIQMRTISGNSICQFKGHIRTCDEPTILQPKDEIGGKLKLLSASEQKLSAVQGALPSQIELWSIISNVRLKAADEMIGRISQQAVQCTGNYCSSDPIDDEFRRSFARSSLPFTMHYFTFSSALQFLTALAVILFYYEKITGLLSIIVSIHTCCRNGGNTTEKTSFCTMMFKGFCVLSKACNPLHPRNIEEEFKLEKMKHRVKKIQNEHREFIAEQASLLQDVSCDISPGNPQIHHEALNELGNTVRLLWLEVDNLKRMVERADTATGLMRSRSKTKLKGNPTGKKSRGLRKYPRIFTTPPVKKRTYRGVRFDIQDTEF